MEFLVEVRLAQDSSKPFRIPSISSPSKPFRASGKGDYKGKQMATDGDSLSHPPALLPSHAAPDSSGIRLSCKRAKAEEVPQHSPASVELSPPQNEWKDTLPLNLKLSVTPSFLDLVELSCASTQNSSVARSTAMATHGIVVDGDKEKQKASNFSASLLRIGSWETRSVNEGDLVAKCYFAKRKLVWEILEGGLKNKIEIAWNDVSAIRATSYKDKSILELELGRPPQFFHEIEPEPRKHARWNLTSDFTGDQATICRRHYIEFPGGKLEKHYGKLLESDDRLRDLSAAPFPRSSSPYFSPNGEEIPSNLNLGMQRDDSPPNVKSQAQALRHGSCVQPRQDPVSSPSQQLQGLQGVYPTGNKFLPIGGAHEISPPTYARRTPVDHGTHSLQFGAQHEHLGASYPTDGVYQGPLLEIVREHLLDDQELPNVVDEQKFLARVRSMGSLIQPDHEGGTHA